MTTEPFLDTGHDIAFTRYNLPASFGGEIQIDHDWELASPELRFHVHLLPAADGAGGDVYWTWQYYFVSIGEAIPAVASWTAGNTTTPLVAGDQYKHTAKTLFTLTPSSPMPSGILLFDVTHASTNVLNTYNTNKDHGTGAANLGILYFDVHYRKNSPGTATEWA